MNHEQDGHLHVGFPKQSVIMSQGGKTAGECIDWTDLSDVQGPDLFIIAKSHLHQKVFCKVGDIESVFGLGHEMRIVPKCQDTRILKARFQWQPLGPEVRYISVP